MGENKKSIKVIVIIAVLCILLTATVLVVLNISKGKNKKAESETQNTTAGLTDENIDQSIYNTNGIDKSEGFDSSDFDNLGKTKEPNNKYGSLEEYSKSNGITIADNESQLDGMEDNFGNDNSYSFDSNKNKYGSSLYNDEEIENNRLSEIEGFADSEKKRLDEAEKKVLEERKRIAEEERQRLAEEERKEMAKAEKKSSAERKRIAEAERKRLEKEEADKIALEEKERKAEEERLAKAERDRKAEQERIAKAEKERKAEEERLAKAERDRKAEQERIAKAEKERKAEEERLAKAERDRKAEQERIAKAEKERKAEQERLAKAERERKALEEERIAKADEKRRAEQAKKAKAEREAEEARLAEQNRIAKQEADKKANERVNVASANNGKKTQKEIDEENYKNDTDAWANNKPVPVVANASNMPNGSQIGSKVGTDNMDDIEDMSNADSLTRELNKLFHEYENTDSNSEKQAILEKALPLANDAIAQGRNDAKAHFFLSRDDYNNRKFNNAIAELNKSISIEDNYLYYHELGKLKYMSKDYNGAIQAFRKACQLNSSFAPSRYNLGLSYVKVNKIDQGLSCYKQAVAIKPDYVQAHLGMARLYKQVRYYDEAIRSYKKAIEIEPRNIPARMDLGVIYNEKGDFASAVDVYTDALNYLTPGEMQTIIKYNLSIALLNEGNVDKALQIAKESYDEKDYMKDDSAKANVVYNYGFIFDKCGKTQQAIDMYEEALSINKSHLKAKINLSVIYMNLENPDMDEVFRLLNEAYVVAPFNSEVNNNLGNAYVKSGDYYSAIVYFETALSANPKDKVVKQNLANAYLKAEDYENAEIVYKEILAGDSKNWQANLDIAKVYIQLGDNDSARKYLEFIKNNNPGFKADEVNGLLGAL